MKFVALAFFVIISMGCIQSVSQWETPEVRIEYQRRDVTFSTTDDVLINGSLYSSRQAGRYPLVILVHQRGADRRQWNEFVPVLINAGYSVLTYDSRGSGESTLKEDGSPAVESIPDMPLDVRGAMDFAMQRIDIDSSRLAVIGASVGAGSAFYAKGVFPELDSAIALSPVQGVSLDANPSNIFILSDENEAQTAMLFFDNSQEPKHIKTYAGGGHGVALLSRDDVRQDVIDWLQKTL